MNVMAIFRQEKFVCGPLGRQAQTCEDARASPPSPKGFNSKAPIFLKTAEIEMAILQQLHGIQRHST
jgi:hypothetical protein